MFFFWTFFSSFVRICSIIKRRWNWLYFLFKIITAQNCQNYKYSKPWLINLFYSEPWTPTIFLWLQFFLLFSWDREVKNLLYLHNLATMSKNQICNDKNRWKEINNLKKRLRNSVIFLKSNMDISHGLYFMNHYLSMMSSMAKARKWKIRDLVQIKWQC